MCNGVVKRYGAVLVAVIFSACGHTAERSAKSGSEPLVEWHFIGGDAIREKKDLTLSQVLALPESGELRKVAVQKLSRDFAARLTKGSAHAQMPVASVISPMLRDIAALESKFELRAGENNGADWMLALRIPEARARLWSTNLWQIARIAKLGQPQPTKDGWTAVGENYSVSLARGKEWTIIYGGMTSAEKQRALFASLEKSLGKPQGDRLLAFRADLPALAPIVDRQNLAHAPAIRLVVTEREPGVRSDLQVDYPTELPLKAEKWNPPTDTIRDPILSGRPALIAFTAIQGIAERVGKAREVQQLQTQKVPNQFYVWNHNISPFSVLWAADVGNPAVVVSNIATRLLPALAKENSSFLAGNFIFNTNDSSLKWTGLPVVVPYVQPAKGKDKSFVTGGFFPTTNVDTNPAPAELYRELEKKNLVYYEWEVTQPRIAQWRPFWQLHYILGQSFVPMSGTPSEKWLEAAAPLLGNTVTEVTLENSKRLKLTRQSDTGFNAMELVLLSHYLDEEDLAPRRPARQNDGANQPAGRTPATRKPARGAPSLPAP